MNLIRVVDGVPTPYTVQQLKTDNPNVSFPKNLPTELLEGYGVYEYIETPKPTPTRFQRVVGGAFRKVDGVWALKWTLENLPYDELVLQVRAERDFLLALSDYTQLSDSPRDKQSWATYRQALRDITDQVGFPEVIDWPAKPN